MFRCGTLDYALRLVRVGVGCRVSLFCVLGSLVRLLAVWIDLSFSSFRVLYPSLVVSCELLMMTPFYGFELDYDQSVRSRLTGSLGRQMKLLEFGSSFVS